MKNDNLNIEIQIDNYIVTILKFSYECHKKDMPFHSHSSNSYEIHFIDSGFGSITVNNKNYELYKNILCTTGPHIEHAQFTDLKNPMCEYCIYLKIEENYKLHSHASNSNILKTIIENPFWYGNVNTEIQYVLNKIQDEFSSPKQAASFMIKSLFMQFIALLVREYSKINLSDLTSKPVPITKSYIIIEDSFLYEYSNLTLEELSKRLGISTRQLTRILHNYYGKSFIQMRTEARMAAAVVFLKEDKLSIAEIAEKIGYSNTNNFQHAFKKHFSITPAKYRTILMTH